MRCPKCQKASLIGAEYCVWCGTPLFGGAEARGRPLSDADGLPEMKRHLDDMAVRLSKVEGSVMRISEHIGLEVSEPHAAAGAADQAPKAELPPEIVGEGFPVEVLATETPAIPPPCEVTPAASEVSPAPPPMEGTAVPETRLGERGSAVPANPVVSEVKAVEPPRRESAPVKPPKPPEPSRLATRLREWEQALPGNWLSRIGMLALLIGLGFLTQWAYANHHLERLPLLLVGLACGGVLLFVGHHWRKAYGAWAQALTGGGIGVLYLSVFASYALYVDHPVMPDWATFLSMFLVTVLSVGIALRRDSMSIAILGIVGAFLVPLTLGAIQRSAGGGSGSGGNNTPFLIAYVLTLDAGVVWLASLRNWRWFTLLGFVGSMAIFSLWYSTSEKEGLLQPAQCMLTGIFLCFAAATTLFHGLRRHRPQLTDLALMTLNAAVYFGVSHYLLWDEFRAWLGSLGFGLAAFYAVLGYLFLRRSKENSLLSAFAFGIAITFFTVAIPVQFEKSYMTAAWAAEGAVLIWLAVRYGTPRWQLWGLGAFALALVRLFAFDQFVDRVHFTPIMNNMFWAFAPSAVAFYAAACFLRQKDKALQPWLFPMMVLLANFLTVWLFSFEIINFAGTRIGLAVGDHIGDLENARNLSLVALWGVYGLALAYGGARKGWVWLRLGGYALVGMAVGTTLVELNYLHARITDGVSNPIANYGFGAVAVCVAVLGLVALIVKKYGDKMTEGEKAAFPVVVSMATVLAVYALSAEVFTFVRNWDVRNLVLVTLWAVYGLGVMIVGLWRGWPWLRAQGWLLSLMAVGMTMTALNYGHFLMEDAPSHPIGNMSFGAFAICVGLVGALAYIMAGNRKGFHANEMSLFPSLVLLANFLALWAFSSEVITFVRDPESENVRNLVLVALWCTYGLGLLIVGIRKNRDWLRVAGYALAVVSTGATLTLLNHSHAMVSSVTHSMPILNYSLGGFAICVVALYLYAYAVARNRELLHDFEKVVCIVVLAAATVLTLWGLSEEIMTFLDGNLQNLMLVILWTGYGSLLMVLGVARRGLLPRLGACALMVMGIGMTMTTLNYGHFLMKGAPAHPIGNYSFGAFAVCVLASYLFAYLTAGRSGNSGSFNQIVCAVALGLASVLTVWALSAEVITFLDDSNLRSLVLVILWSGYGLLLMLAGAWKRVPVARLAAYALVATAVGMTTAMLNHGRTGLQRLDYYVLINPSFGGFLVCVTALYLTSYLMGKNSSKLLDAEKPVLTVLIVAANALSLFALSSEVLTYASAGYGQSMGLTMLWASYGLAVMVVGIVGKWPWVRLGGLALVSVAILKLFLWDTFHLQSGYRVAAYLTLGVLLLAGGFVYHRYADVIKGFIMDRPEKGAGSARK